jgi:hypothetical protein
MKLLFLALAAVAAGSVLGGTAEAQSVRQQRGYQYVAPGTAFVQTPPGKGTLMQPAVGLPRPYVAPGQTALNPAYAGRTVGSSSSVRPAVGNRLPASLFVQYGPVGGAQPAAPGATSAPAGQVPMSSAAPAPGGISSIYAYSGRPYGPYYANAVQFYSYGGNCGWGSPYNSIYYNSGCYLDNACCRSSRRLCTPFGGMGYGCGPGCYVATSPLCPTGCDRYGTMSPSPSIAPPTYAPPPAGNMQPQAKPQPQPMPPVPQPPVETPDPPQPLEKEDPQASNSPRVPVLPRIPNLPET